MAIKTQGFSLSALPRSPNIPDKIGQIDVRAIYDGVKQGLSTFEAVRTAPKSMALADATMDSETALAPLKPRLALAQTQGAEQRIPMENALLADKAAVSQATTPVATTSAQNAQAAQGQAGQQFADFTDAYAKAQSNADYATKAHELEQLPIRFPFLTQAPEYKTLLARIADSTQAARIAANQEAARGNAVDIAGLRATGALTPGQKLVNDLIRLQQEYVANPDDPYLPQRIEHTQALLNKAQSESRANPTAQRNLQKELGEARNRTLEERNKMAFDKQANAANNAVISAEVNADHVNSLVDNALSKVSPLTVGFGATTLSKLGGTEGADLRATRDTIRSIVTLQTLADLRALSATGGALGNVSDADLRLLGNAIASLDQDQSVTQFKQNLEIIRKRMSDISANRKEAYGRQFGPEAHQRIFGAPTATSPAPTAAPNAPAPYGEFKFEVIEVR